MVSQSAIYSVLIGVVLTGVIPLIAGIVLLATKKIKGTSFWAGVLTFVITIIVTAIAVSIISLFTVSPAEGPTLVPKMPLWQTILISVISAVIMGFAMLILIKCCMKARTFKAAVSAGLGFGISQLIAMAVSFASMYMIFSQVNSGAFDQQYAMLVNTGYISKEMVAELKAIYTSYTVIDVLAQIIATIGNVLIMLAAAIIIMLFVTRKKAIIGALITIAGISALGVVSTVIPNVLAASVVAAAIGAAAFIFACRMKDSIVAPEKPTAANDAFMQSIANAKKED